MLPIDQIKQAVNLPALIGSYVQLRKQGKSYVGLCPFHTEKTPSFRVHADFYKCFGCSAAGDAFKFLMEIEHMTFTAAARELADRFGVQVPDAPVPVDPAAERRKRTYSDQLEAEVSWWRTRTTQALCRRRDVAATMAGMKWGLTGSSAPYGRRANIWVRILREWNALTAAEITAMYLRRRGRLRAEYLVDTGFSRRLAEILTGDVP